MVEQHFLETAERFHMVGNQVPNGTAVYRISSWGNSSVALSWLGLCVVLPTMNSLELMMVLANWSWNHKTAYASIKMSLY